jgi:ABC-2 type transport system ATP-binding protein
MQEVEAVCDRVIIIRKGTVLIDKTLDELQKNHQQIIKVIFNNKVNATQFERLASLVSSKDLGGHTWELTFENKEDMRPKLFDFAQENNLTILELSSANKTLESLFTELTSH